MKLVNSFPLLRAALSASPHKPLSFSEESKMKSTVRAVALLTLSLTLLAPLLAHAQPSNHSFST